jgi:transposase
LAKIIVLVHDKGFDSDEIRQHIEDNGGLACIPPRSNRTSHRWSDPEFYRKRHLVKNIFQRLKYWRRVATCYENALQLFSPSQHSLPQLITFNTNKSTRLENV